MTALTNQAVARSFGGEHDDTAFQEALEAAEDRPRSLALVRLNQATGMSRKHQDADAVHVGRLALQLALEADAPELAAAAHYNLVTYHEHLEHPGEARAAYRRCLELAEPIGDHRLVGLSLVGLAALDHDPEAGREGIAQLREGGFMAAAALIEHHLIEFTAGSGGTSQP